MTVGVYLMTRMSISTGLLEAAIYMAVAGIGIGIFFSVLTLAVQNALPRTQLGVGTGAVRYLSQLGSTLGVAIVGTVVNNTVSSDIINRLPASAVKQLTPAGLKFATNPQVLVNSTYHDTVVKTAERFAVAQATSHIPPGPQHNQAAAAAAAQAIQQVQHVVKQPARLRRDEIDQREIRLVFGLHLLLPQPMPSSRSSICSTWSSRRSSSR